MEAARRKGRAASTCGTPLRAPRRQPRGAVGRRQHSRNLGSVCDQARRQTSPRWLSAATSSRNCRRRSQLPSCTQEYNNGEPEKQGSEARNYQKYLDRTAGA